MDTNCLDSTMLFFIYNNIKEKLFLVILQYFPKFLRKIALPFLLLFFNMGLLWAQEPCETIWHPKIKVDSASCLGNGKFIYWLEDASGHILPRKSSQAEFESTYKIEKVRFFHRKLNEVDSTYSDYYQGGIDTVFVAADIYIAGLQGVCLESGSNKALWYGEIDTIPSSYSVLKGRAMSNVATATNEYGIRPTLSCMNTGRVQLKIEEGKLPYTVEIVNHNDPDESYSYVFNGPTCPTCTNDKLSSYKDYYTIDGLGAGTWDFYIQDGCDYGLGVTTAEITVVDPPIVKRIDVFASSGNMNDSNVVKVNAQMSYAYQYYLQQFKGNMSYRIRKADSDGSEPWNKFISIAETQTLFDTLDVSSYCELYRELLFEYKIKIEGCTADEGELYSFNFSYNPPNNSSYYETSYTTKTDSLKKVEPCLYTRGYHTESWKIRYRSNDLSHVNKNNDHSEHRHHYTAPLTWIFYTQTGTEKDTIEIQEVSSINTYAELMYDPAFGNQRINISLVDAHQCPLYSTRLNPFVYKEETETVKPKWKVNPLGTGDHCCENRAIEVKMEESNLLRDSIQIDTVKLIQSPLGNQYNFVASYSNLQWTLYKPHVLNDFEIDNDNEVFLGKLLRVKGACVPSGKYQFVVVTSCGPDTLDPQTIHYGDVHSVEQSEDPVYEIDIRCGTMFVKFTQGQYVLSKSNTDSGTGEIIYTHEPLNTSFSIVSGVTGGYNKNAKYSVNEEIPLTISGGTYVIRMFPNPTNNEKICGSNEYVDISIEHNGTFINLDYEGALLCSKDDPKGNLYIAGKDSKLPFIYTVYENTNLQGDTIACVVVNSDSTIDILTQKAGFLDSAHVNGDGVVFYGVPMSMGSGLSCRIQDSCGAHFPVNIYPQTLSSMQKIWFDNNQRESTVCEGDSVQIHALEYGHIFGYEWRGPNGYTSTTPNPIIVLQRGSTEGWYRVTIHNHGCEGDIMDSVLLSIKESPKLTMSPLHPETTCPGDTVSLSYTPVSPIDVELGHNGNPVSFTLAFASRMGMTYQTYENVPSGSECIIKYVPMDTTKVYPVFINDHQCSYNHADAGDTIVIETYEQKSMLNNCNLLTTDDRICVGETAHLSAKGRNLPYPDAPYTIQWFSDFALTNLLQTDIIYDEVSSSEFDTANLTENTAFYVKIAQEGMCPSHQALADQVFVMNRSQHNRRTTFDNCNVNGSSHVLRVYDSGGPENNYGEGELIQHYFESASGHTLTIHFDELDLAQGSSLMIFSGREALGDSMLCRLLPGSDIPDVIVSRSRQLTLLFTSQGYTAGGWSALVQASNSMAVAEVRKPKTYSIQDRICQTHYLSYEDRLNVLGTIVDTNIYDINEMIKTAGTYPFMHTYKNGASNGCDSIVVFTLIVDPPAVVDTTVVTLSLNLPYHWPNRGDYYETGEYSYPVKDPATGCDIDNRLKLIVLEIDEFTSYRDTCEGENVVLGVHVITPDIPMEFPTTNHIGDVLCQNDMGQTYLMSPDEYLSSGEPNAIGVVFFLDASNDHGKAIALRDAYEGLNGRNDLERFPGECLWASGKNNPRNNEIIYRQIHSGRMYSLLNDALYDMSGIYNTDTIKKSVLNAAQISETDENFLTTFRTYAPAAFYCYYYNAEKARTTPGDNAYEGFHSGWYMPSLGEFSLYYANRLLVDRTLQKLQHPPHNAQQLHGRVDVTSSQGSYQYDESYWTSTEGNDVTQAYRVSGKGQIIYNKKNYTKAISTNNPTFVRAIIDF